MQILFLLLNNIVIPFFYFSNMGCNPFSNSIHNYTYAKSAEDGKISVTDETCGVITAFGLRI
jgi:hypothetical protein